MKFAGIPPVLRGEPTMGRFLTDVHILSLRDAKVGKIILNREIFLSHPPFFRVNGVFIPADGNSHPGHK